MQIEGVSKTGDIRSSASCIKTAVACRSCTSGTRQRFLAGYCIDRRGGCGSGGSRLGRRSRSAWRPLSVAAFVDCCEEWPNATLRRQASKVAAWLLPARPGPCSRLCLLGEVMCTTGYDRLPHRCCGLDLCLDCLRPACTAACVSWVAPTLPRSP